MRELEDFEIEVTVTSMLSEEDILNLELICNRQLDKIELLKIAKFAVLYINFTECLELIKQLKYFDPNVTIKLPDNIPLVFGYEKDSDYEQFKNKTFEM